ncbi:hypothetical protein BVRB_1g018850 [Beta vulgaris subsp. vulgaris]|nr:hypothetical protein BVRB_1g018850 [Beta vulgaris subsp. vulgaris]
MPGSTCKEYSRLTKFYTATALFIEARSILMQNVKFGRRC